MKNFKKISREQLKQVAGGGPSGPGVGNCRVGYIYLCKAEGICDDDKTECVCLCVPANQIPG
ncbi:hypothetical protein C1637_15455 [Chryseobacterium lactis]|uniref:Bacteriocin n=1 Tax=Chryseobacterium lactis TaxID=1241981 RepID=A0A3G6RKX3_CHRLC|nr:hypothetical protein EG342_17110 [Chryseobacterium lactis]AZB03879.1 hypothetical protein EG341_07985 [Chryseobacterium lactis]PNW13211.1 hypothetical protein C1637_15455 [Chryseobacterium lactis]